MTDPEKGLLETLAADAVSSALNMRFDICTCPSCRLAITDQVLENMPSALRQFDCLSRQEIAHDDLIKIQSALSRLVASAIHEISNHPTHRIIEDKAETLKNLIKKIRDERSLDLRHYHLDLLKRRLALRIRSNNLSSYASYMHFLTKNPTEYDRLFETLCINVSEFFRDPPVWITMRHLLETLVRKKIDSQETALTIWSAGCACGEEPYSIAVILKDILKHNLHNLRPKIHATDIDKACLNAAAQAQYEARSLANCDSGLLKKYFDPQGEERYQLKDTVKELVTVHYLDLTTPETIVNTDLVVCRNVFIYFDHDLQGRIIKKFCEALLPGGYLLLGKTEILPFTMSCLFEEIDASARIYRKKPD